MSRFSYYKNYYGRDFSYKNYNGRGYSYNYSRPKHPEAPPKLPEAPPPRYSNIPNERENNLLKLFRIFGSIPRWNGYPLLFIMVCKCDDQNDSEVMKQLAEIQESIEEINNNGGASPYQLESIKEILNEYKKLRLTHDEKKMSELIENVGEELRQHSVKDHKDFLEQLKNLTVQERLVLREICISRLVSFSDFANYINIYRDKIPDGQIQQPLDEIITEQNDRFLKKRNISGSTEYDESKQSTSHQAKLGNVVNFRWCDDDPNNSMQLIKDIEKLQSDLQSFTGVKGVNVQINQEAVSELFKRYNCSTKCDDKAMKVVLAAVLQRRIFDFIHEISENFKRRIPTTDTNLEDDHLEAGIISRTGELIPLISRFSEFNTGNDEHTRVLPIKLRQQIYAALSNRGFNNQNHQLVQQTLEGLIKEMEKYRKIESQEKNKQNITKATLIIQQVLNIFCFRLNTQEPIPSILYYENGDPIDIELMDCTCQGDVKDFVVEICSFPAIVVNEYEKRVFTKAKVTVRPKI
ncbi:8841_t:CDS:2 [Gigaspora margarita]|uniref:8841_t:CDS:1 n=1 Tax=Gigaspora margarita TaxID=4874 RepID=A0ABM8VW96_GIGMA|nr:8841_t:CDS:2 [Gigaspora margarita]